MVNHGIGRTDDEARTVRNLANAIADALVSAVQRCGRPLRTVAFDAPGSGGHQTWAGAGASECSDCLRARARFRSPVEPALVAHFCLTCWELVLERDGARVAWTSRRLARVLRGAPAGTTRTAITAAHSATPAGRRPAAT